MNDQKIDSGKRRSSRDRGRRVQLAVPASDARKIESAAKSRADHVFLDLEDAVAPAAKAGARNTAVAALRDLDWSGKTCCVRINDLRTPWCHDDIIEIVSGAGDLVDTLMLTKALKGSDVEFLDTMLLQLELKLGLSRRIGIEVLIEEVEGLERVVEIAAASSRTEALVFGMGDYAAAHRIDVLAMQQGVSYPGDIWYYPRFRCVMAARMAGIDMVDGPFAELRNERRYREECERARLVGCDGKWALHPSQIEVAIDVFTPAEADVAMARKVAAAYAEAERAGIGAISVDGLFVDAATMRVLRNTLRRAERCNV